MSESLRRTSKQSLQAFLSRCRHCRKYKGGAADFEVLVPFEHFMPSFASLVAFQAPLRLPLRNASSPFEAFVRSLQGLRSVHVKV